jgi:hypothetical protein
MNKETLEEVAEKESEVQGWGKYESTPEQHAIKYSFINGYNLAEKSLYSEEEVKLLLDKVLIDHSDIVLADIPKWFENNKKK